ncbi:hypothetical protein KKB44_04180 [Candidatus Micrarchaeota archaeon]|nr:hypothetical protein [Candidatus Micrarchaeota archaeon]
MTRFRAIVRQGPAVVKNALVYGFNLARYKLRQENFNLTCDTVRSMSSNRAMDTLDNAMKTLGDSVGDVLVSGIQLKRSVNDFRVEWRNREPATEGLRS